MQGTQLLENVGVDGRCRALQKRFARAGEVTGVDERQSAADAGTERSVGVGVGVG